MQTSKNQPLVSSSSKENSNNTPQNTSEIEKAQDNTKNQEKITENIVEKGKSSSHNTKTQSDKPFYLEAEIDKLKISIPLSELAKHDVYRQQIKRSLQMLKNRDDVNVLDDTPELLFGPEVDGKTVNEGVLPFYVSLHIHDKVFHNEMFDSGASHNLMPKSVMEKLNLDITRPYKDLFLFDFSQVKCLGLIKDLCVSLVQYPSKTILMDVVVVEIPPKYGMLLSRSWGAKLQGSLQLDLSYATILVFGQPKRLYRETLMKYVVSSEEKPQNFPIYFIHSDMDSFILFNADNSPPTDDKPLSLQLEICINEESVAQDLETAEMNDITRTQDKLHETENIGLPTLKMTKNPNTDQEQEILWYLEFDGLVNKLGVEAGVWIHNM